LQGKLKEKGLARVSVYLNKDELSSMAQMAERLGYRRVGLPLEVKAEHGFSNEMVSNTDGISRVLKFCFEYYAADYPKRLAKKAALQKEIDELGV